jgi:calcineurin-like phosphoesterase family protein
VVELWYLFFRSRARHLRSPVDSGEIAQALCKREQNAACGRIRYMREIPGSGGSLQANIPSPESPSVFGEGSFLEVDMIFFTADTHFGHDKIIEYCNRPFRSVEEMDKEMIFRWNELIKSNDRVFHLGDFCFGDPKRYLDRLNGDIILLRGSHDHEDKYFAKDSIMNVSFSDDEYGHKRWIILCHYSMRSWYRSHYASWHLFGHHHGRLPPHGLSFDVGVDVWGFRPISLHKVEEKMATLLPIVDLRRKRESPQ